MIKVFEVFTGYGGASYALKKAGIEFECVGFSEVDKYAIQCYEQNHCLECDYNTPSGWKCSLFPKNYGDCTKIIPEELPDLDILTGGFLCQSFSIAGKRKGFEDTRGTLFFDILRIAKVKKPKYMVLENVKGLVNHEDGKTFKTIINALKSIGYGVAYKVLNSKHYGIPQNRERIWIVCKYGGWEFMEFQFPHKEKLNLLIKDILEEEIDNKYYLSDKAVKTILNRNHKQFDGIAPCMTKGMHKLNESTPIIADYRRDEGLRVRKDNCCPTIKAKSGGGLTHDILVHSLFPRSSKTGEGGTEHLSKSDGTSYCVDTVNCQAIESEARWRRLTPTECFRLMGFLDDDINLDNLSDTQKYRLAGNGWEITVASKIFKRLLT